MDEYEFNPHAPTNAVWKGFEWALEYYLLTALIFFCHKTARDSAKNSKSSKLWGYARIVGISAGIGIFWYIMRFSGDRTQTDLARAICAFLVVLAPGVVGAADGFKNREESLTRP
jgi:hypothetical protein